MTKLLPGLALILATFGCGGDDDDDSGGTDIDATPSGSDAATGADAAPAPDGGTDTDAAVGDFAIQMVRPSCAPNDALAIRVLLGTAADGDGCALDEDAESVQFEVWTREIEAPAIFSFAPGEALGTAQMCPGGGDPCRSYETAQIQFDAYEEGGAASGTWTVYEGETMIDGDFTATWCEPVTPEPCG
jgi:hypothetical protein